MPSQRGGCSWHHGYAGTTVAAVADDAGVSPETIYVSLGGKRGLLEGVMDITGPHESATDDDQWWDMVAGCPTDGAARPDRRVQLPDPRPDPADPRHHPGRGRQGGLRGRPRPAPPGPSAWPTRPTASALPRRRPPARTDRRRGRASAIASSPAPSSTTCSRSSSAGPPASTSGGSVSCCAPSCSDLPAGDRVIDGDAAGRRTPACGDDEPRPATARAAGSTDTSARVRIAER